ncbi:uncharacterized protein SCHCODRAFT_02074216 [Schizophyllum commune H4-8]|uniref:uncharacterized protein n=1 Tax=Schizophyllum commune (strain H4-8 / FGSC 9210) TaxID=578458 RepID=UPI00215EF3AA|nr:uncharacterized protein SCHCODRAFT_02074216 [Schizophyllum commune H4-8]KAI5887899.1 hypothetical protein SCHCODRAFT_02074216 [Schizophyllum commune H4-8]
MLVPVVHHSGVCGVITHDSNLLMFRCASSHSPLTTDQVYGETSTLWTRILDVAVRTRPASWEDLLFTQFTSPTAQPNEH